MLLAKSMDGQLINLADHWEREDLERLRARSSFVCPICSSSVQMKIGSKRIWHFSHLDTKECDGQHEPESMYHLTAKQQLYQWLKSTHTNVKMEHYFKHFKQRPDILLSTVNRLYAIEFQCSIIPEHLLQKRSATFRMHQIEPYWILGHSRLSSKSDLMFRMDDVAWNAAHYPGKSDPYLIYYSPESQLFTILQSIIPFSSRTVFATLHTIPRKQATFPLQPLKGYLRFPEPFIQPWKNLLQQTRLYLHLNRDSAVISLKKKLLSKGVPVSLFPVEAGLPTKFSYWIKSPSYIWQSRFLLELIDPIPIGDSIRFQDIYKDFLQMFYRFHLKKRVFATRPDTHISFAIMDYMNRLVDIGILKRKTSIVFQKSTHIVHPNTIAEANQRLEVILQKFMI
jgi:competence protein CoiA